MLICSGRVCEEPATHAYIFDPEVWANPNPVLTCAGHLDGLHLPGVKEMPIPHLRFEDGGTCNDPACNLWPHDGSGDRSEVHFCESLVCRDSSGAHGAHGAHGATAHVFVDKTVYFFLCTAAREALEAGDFSQLFQY